MFYFLFFSVLCINDDLTNSGGPIMTGPVKIQLSNGNPIDDNTTDNLKKCNQNTGSVDSQPYSWLGGIMTCMKPVWSMLSKAAVGEKIKGSQGTI